MKQDLNIDLMMKGDCEPGDTSCKIQQATRVTFQGDANGKCKLFLATMIACIGSMAVGFTGGYPSTAVPNINDHRNPFHFDSDSQSWFSSMGYLGAIIGAVPTGRVIDKFGRKLGLMVATLPFIVGWIIIAAAQNACMAYAGRLLTGMACPLILTSVNVYTAEISPPEIRGLLVSLNQTFMQLGLLVIYTAGTYVNWNWLTVICSVPPVIMTISLIGLPETPRWLFMKGRNEEALEALKWFRPQESSVEREVQEIQISLKEVSDKPPNWKDFFCQPILKYLAISQILFILQEMAGINVVRTYTVTIFQSTNALMNANIATIIVGAVMTSGSVLATLIVDRLRRRTLLIISFLTMTMSMTALGTFFYFRENHNAPILNYLHWLPLSSLSIFTISYAIGCGPLPHAITSELFSTPARGRAYSIAITTDYVFGFLTTKCFSYVRMIAGEHGTFWTFGCVSFLGALFAFLFVPETKGRSLEELQQEFNTKPCNITHF